MKKKLKHIGIILSTIVCSYITLIVSIAFSGICSGWNEGSMSVTSCRFGGDTMIMLSNDGYAFVFLGVVFMLIPLVLWLTGLIGGWFYWKKRKHTPLGKGAMVLILLNLFIALSAIVLAVTTK